MLVAPPSRMMTGGVDDGHRPGSPRGSPDRTTIRPTAPRRTCAGPCEPSRHPIPVDPPGPTSSRPLARRLPSRVLDATKSYLVSLCLADECYRPNCQRIRYGFSRTHRLNTGFAEIAGEFASLTPTRRHRPESGAFGQLTPAVIRPSVSFARQRLLYRPRLSRQIPERFFSKSLKAAGRSEMIGRWPIPSRGRLRPSKRPDLGHAKAMIPHFPHITRGISSNFRRCPKSGQVS
jgi:hypothetical protein